MPKFTEADVIGRAREIYGKPVTVNSLRDAMEEDTLEEAAQVLVIDSQYWDGVPLGPGE